MRKNNIYYSGWESAKSHKLPALFAILNTVVIVMIVVIICYVNRLKYEETTAYVPVETQVSAAKSSSENASLTHYVQPDGGDWNLILVNQWNRSDGVPRPDLLEETEYGQIDQRVTEMLNRLMTDGKAYRLKVTKAYAEDDTDIEHCTGLAVDLTVQGVEQDTSELIKSDGYAWLLQNCAKYGFILRYPEGKEKITGHAYSGVHFRYVGEEAAKSIMNKGITLEEYLEAMGK